MSVFDIEGRLDKGFEFIVLIQKKIEENIRKNRVLVIVTGEDWAQYNYSPFFDYLKKTSLQVSTYPKPLEYGYGENFLINLIEICREKGSDMVLFNNIEKIEESAEKDQWLYLINLAAEGKQIELGEGLKFDFTRRGLILVCKEPPEFIKSNPTLYPAIIELNNVSSI